MGIQVWEDKAITKSVAQIRLVNTLEQEVVISLLSEVDQDSLTQVNQEASFSCIPFMYTMYIYTVTIPSILPLQSRANFNLPEKSTVHFITLRKRKNPLFWKRPITKSNEIN